MKIKEFEELIVYLYYDGNILYTITNGKEIYLCFWYNTNFIKHADYEHEIQIDDFIYIKTNQTEIDDLENHLISLNNYFELKSKAKQMFLITHDFNYTDIDLSTLEPYTDFKADEVWDGLVYLTYYLE